MCALSPSKNPMWGMFIYVYTQKRVQKGRGESGAIEFCWGVRKKRWLICEKICYLHVIDDKKKKEDEEGRK
jgi:hypothetical protein